MLVLVCVDLMGSCREGLCVVGMGVGERCCPGDILCAVAGSLGGGVAVVEGVWNLIDLSGIPSLSTTSSPPRTCPGSAGCFPLS